MSSKLGISAGTHSLDRVSNFDIEEKPVKFFYSPNNNIQNYSVFPDDDIESLRNHFHIQIKEMISKQDFSNLPEIYEKLNQISLKSNLRNFVPSPKSLLFLLSLVTTFYIFSLSLHFLCLLVTRDLKMHFIGINLHMKVVLFLLMCLVLILIFCFVIPFHAFMLPNGLSLKSLKQCGKTNP